MLVTVRLRSHTLTYIHSQINLEELPFWGEGRIRNLERSSNYYHQVALCCPALSQWCPTLRPGQSWPLCSPPGSTVHGITQERILEWAAVSSPWGIFPAQGSAPRLLHWQADSLLGRHLGSLVLSKSLNLWYSVSNSKQRWYLVTSYLSALICNCGRFNAFLCMYRFQ